MIEESPDHLTAGAEPCSPRLSHADDFSRSHRIRASAALPPPSEAAADQRGARDTMRDGVFYAAKGFVLTLRAGKLSQVFFAWLLILLPWNTLRPF
jgi:hypothetical protein